ncbi:MAG: HYR domain-containing protein [Sphingobacteriales bacterium]|nr:MAG: HYR domain-containing protein [Sphingobacteriales bacterium]
MDLDNTGNATIAEDAVNNGSTDACGGLTFDTDITTFNCSNVGENVLVLTVTDANGNSSTCSATVTIEDNTPPTAVCQNITVDLDNTGNATIAEDAINNGSTDACGGLTFDTDITVFNCSAEGENTVVLTVTDANGNTNSCSATVTVEDNTPPVTVCQNITVELDNIGNTTIAEDAVNNGSTDACGGLTFDTDITTFNCSVVGENAVVLTVTDANGNTNTCSATVTIEDDVPPTAVCQNITVDLDNTGNTTIAEDAVNNGSTDACGGLTFDTDITVFNCSVVGENTVVLTVTDANGNTNTCSATVTIEDNTPPTAVCQNITVELDNTGNATIAEDAVNNGSTDACGGLTFDTDITVFNCSNVGENIVVLTVTDAHGNTNSCSATVTVEDNTPPVAVCQNITVELDNTGNATITENAVNNGSNDACGGLTFDTDITVFNCSVVGENTVVLTVTDANGNTNTCSATVTVEDDVPPTAICQNITVELDNTGNATIAEDEVNNGSADACGGLTFDTDITIFNCSNVGENAVVLTVTDAHGNTNTCSATVTVEDNTTPTAVCQNITVELDNTGNATIAEDAVNNGSADACGGLTFDTDITIFNCSNVGENAVVLTVTDAHGNTNTCSATVSAEDNVAPTAVCQNITVELDNTGNATIAEDAVNNGSTDACGGLTFDTDITTFNCSVVGENAVVLTVTDANGNTNTCSATVTVEDNTPPTALCQNIVVELDNTGNASIAEDAVNNGSTDACGSLTFDTDITVFNCSDVGENAVVLTVTDAHGNTNTCSATVTVEDNVQSTAVCQNITVELDNTGNATITEDAVNNGSTDACGGLTFDTDITVFNCSDVGENAVVLTVTDANENTNTCSATVTVEDDVPPTAVCQNITVELDNTGNATIAEDAVNNGSTDACGGLTFDTDITTYNCSDVGENVVILIVTDANGNTNTCSATVSVEDNVAPTAVCQNITVDLDNTGNAIIAEDSVNNGSTDACGGLTFDTDITTFSCSNVGENAVVLTITDANENTNSCSATVTVEDDVAPTTVCQNITVELDNTGSATIAEDAVNNGSADACGGLTFDTDITVFNCSVVGENAVILTVTDANGNSSTCSATVTVEDDVPPTAVCQNITVDLDNTGNAAIAEDAVNNGSADACGGLTFDTNITTFNCSNVGENAVVLTVTDANGNTNTCSATVSVEDNTPPTAVCQNITVELDNTGNATIAEDAVNNGSNDACGGLTFDTDITTFNCSVVGENAVVLTVTDAHGNTNSCSATVTVEDNTTPTAVCQNITVELDNTGNATIAEDAVNNGSTDACGGLTFDTNITTFNCSVVGENTVVLTVTDANGNTNTCSATVTIEDNTPPTAVCQNITVDLDNTGNATIAEDAVNNGSNDACGGLTFDTDITTFNCSDVGENTIVLTVTDANGNSSTCSATVTVEDNTPPTAVCQNITVELDNTGNATIAEDAVNNGSTDACGGLTFDTDITTFNCSNVGENAVVLTVTDANGNTNTCSATVTVEDDVPPTAVCQNITVELDNTGNATIAEDAVNNGSTDACGGLTFDTDVTTFNCSDVGENTVVLTVTDVHGNTNTCSANVTVEDNTPPTAVCQNITVDLDNNGNATITEDAVNNGSTDACGGLTFDTDITTFNCSNVGENAVVLTVTNVNGNSSTCSATVTIEDNTPPTAVCQNITVELDNTGNAAIAEDAVNNGSNDACGGLSFDTNVTVFNCSDVGENAVVLTVTDAHGNTNTCSATVTIEDNTPPIAVCQNITVELDNTGNATIAEDAVNNGISDACGGLTFDTDITTFNCSDVGENTVVLTVTDANGNTNTCSATVTIEDNTPPVAVCQNITVELDNTGNATIAEDAVNNGSNDACGGLTFDTDITVFNCSAEGENTVVLTVTDANGNTNSCSATVTVEDNTPPVTVCQNITVELDNIGNTTIAEDAVNNGSTDACGGLTFDTDITTFNCSVVGENAVVLTVTDANGNTNTCSATVTIEDDVPPTAVCQNITVDLDNTGNTTIAEDAVNNGSTDACGGLTFDTDITTFNCSNVEENTVVLTVTDANGNTNTCSATVTVADDVPPTAVCQNITVELDNTGNAIIAEDAVNNGSSDACGGLTFDTDITTFNCSDVGENAVVLTVTDANGISSTCSATVTVEDNTPPTAVCQNITVELDNTGNATIAEDAVNNGSNDACGGLTFDTDITVFNCSVVGENTVVLTVTDANGNTNTCSATVTVEDDVPPTAVCQNITVELDNTGNATIAEDAVNNGSSDACGGLTFDTDITTFNCSVVGENTVVLTVTDANGNTNTCSATVTVEDDVPPTAVCQNITVELDNTGNATIAEDAVNNGSSDACGGLTFDTDITTFNCSNAGENAVVLTVTDANGISSTCSATVTVEDNTPPTAVCQNINVELDNTGNATIAEDAVNNGSNDACGGLTFDTDITVFNCSVVGENTVVLTVTDANGNTNTCSATVTVEDNNPPVAVCQNITVELDNTGNAIIAEDAVNNGSTDACGGLTFDTDITTFNCLNVGENVVVLTVTDANGNTNTCSATVSVEDNTPPTATCQNITVELDNTGNATIAEDAVNNGSSDACGGLTFDTDITTFNCSNVGENAVVLTVTDANGNTNICSATVTIEDNTPPTAVCQNITVDLDNTGNATIAEDAVNNGSNDACGGLTLDTDITVFNCSNVGENAVVLTITDANGNTGTCSTIVLVTNDFIPLISCPSNIETVAEFNMCSTVVTWTEPTISDNCAIQNISSSAVSGSAFNVGNTVVVYTVTNTIGSTATCSFNVLVNDLQVPTVSCPENIIQFTDLNNCNAIVNWTTPLTTDNCNISSIISSIQSGSQINIGTTIVVYTVTDISGNTASCSFNVEVNDAQAPVINNCPQDFVTCLTQPTWDEPTATDNCNLVSLIGSHLPGSIFSMGSTTVVYTATDNNNLTTECTFNITVSDLMVTFSQSNFNGFGVSCFDEANGTLTAEPNGGSGNYLFEWSNSSNNQSLSSLTAGSYTVTITDQNSGCFVIGTQNLTQPTTIHCTAIPTHIECNGELTGSISTTITGGIPPYNYLWSNGAQTSNLSDVGAGSYTLTTTDSNGCICILNVAVNEPVASEPFTGTVVNIDEGEVNPTFFELNIITLTGGVQPYNYSWITNGYVQYSYLQTGEIQVVFAQGATWSLIVTDSNSCDESQLQFDNYSDPAGNLEILSFAIVSDNGENTGAISIIVGGGNLCLSGNYQYSWSGPSYWSTGSGNNSPVISNLPSGWYVVTVTDCGPDGISNSGDEQSVVGWYWVPKQIRGRGKTDSFTIDSENLIVYPNPFVSNTNIVFTLPQTEHAVLSLHDLYGREIALLYNGLVNENQETKVILDGTNLTSGLYICKLSVPERNTAIQKQIYLIK